MNFDSVVPLLSLMMTALTLFVNNHWAANREKRKEFKSRMDDIFNLLREIEEKAVKFHTSDEYSEEAADEIKWKMNRMSMLSQSITHFTDDGVSKSFVEFKKSVMLENFNRSKFRKVDSNSKIVIKIHGSATKLFKNMLDIYTRSHKL